MIATIEGVLAEKEGTRVVVDVGGVGFEIHVPVRILETIGSVGSRIKLHTHLHVREDNLSLYGFLSEDERHMFQSLIGVSGVGPKVALAVLSVSDVDELSRLISQGKTERLVAFPGIGKKTAERIVLELKDKLKFEAAVTVEGEGRDVEIDRSIYEEAVEALESLGISRQNASRALASIRRKELGGGYGVEDVIKLALARFARKG